MRSCRSGEHGSGRLFTNDHIAEIVGAVLNGLRLTSTSGYSTSIACRAWFSPAPRISFCYVIDATAAQGKLS
jgi:hypothetical protein